MADESCVIDSIPRDGRSRALKGVREHEGVLPSHCRSGSGRDALGCFVFSGGWLQQERHHVQRVVVSVLPTS